MTSQLIREQDAADLLRRIDCEHPAPPHIETRKDRTALDLLADALGFAAGDIGSSFALYVAYGLWAAVVIALGVGMFAQYGLLPRYLWPWFIAAIFFAAPLVALPIEAARRRHEDIVNRIDETLEALQFVDETVNAKLDEIASEVVIHGSPDA